LTKPLIVWPATALLMFTSFFDRPATHPEAEKPSSLHSLSEARFRVFDPGTLDQLKIASADAGSRARRSISYHYHTSPAFIMRSVNEEAAVRNRRE